MSENDKEHPDRPLTAYSPNLRESIAARRRERDERVLARAEGRIGPLPLRDLRPLGPLPTATADLDDKLQKIANALGCEYGMEVGVDTERGRLNLCATSSPHHWYFALRNNGFSCPLRATSLEAKIDVVNSGVFERLYGALEDDKNEFLGEAPEALETCLPKLDALLERLDPEPPFKGTFLWAIDIVHRGGTVRQPDWPEGLKVFSLIKRQGEGRDLVQDCLREGGRLKDADGNHSDFHVIEAYVNATDWECVDEPPAKKDISREDVITVHHHNIRPKPTPNE